MVPSVSQKPETIIQLGGDSLGEKDNSSAVAFGNGAEVFSFEHFRGPYGLSISNDRVPASKLKYFLDFSNR